MHVRLYLCSSGKKLFLTEAAAWQRLCEVRALCRKAGRTEPTRIYECPECHYWHFSSTPRRKRR